jgi:CRISPR/Cas system-associated endonuclease/helicase Cas3
MFLVFFNDKILAKNHEDKKWKPRHHQYLNIYEWLSFLVNHGEITEKDIKDFFKPMLLSDHDTVLGLSELKSHKNDSSAFKKSKELYKQRSGSETR